MDWLSEFAPVIAIWGIGVSIMFNGLNWSRDRHTRKFGWLVFGFGIVIFVAGLAAYAACDVFNLIALLVAIAAVVLGLRFIYKDP